MKLKRAKPLSLSEFNLNTEVSESFNDFVSNHSLYAKANNDGFEINLVLDEELILNPTSQTHSYEASILTDFLRQELIKKGEKVSFETVMSPPSKIETLKFSHQHDYKNYLYFISTDSAEINKSRVIERVLNGGHPVPEDKIEERYFRSLGLLRETIKYTYRTFIFDNSEKKARLILDIYQGTDVTYRNSSIPKWVDKYCLNI